jgi:hypothetical protein
VTIRQNVFESSRARGVLVATPGRVVIERNRFESSGSAILIAGDANQGQCLRAGASPHQFGEGILSVSPEIPASDPAFPFRRQHPDRGQRVPPVGLPVLYAKSVDGLTSPSRNDEPETCTLRPVHARTVLRVSHVDLRDRMT